MSYIVRASWWSADSAEHVASLAEAEQIATNQIFMMKQGAHVGTVTITKDGEVIREYKVGEKE